VKRSRATSADINVLRVALGELQPGSAHQAQNPPNPSAIFAPLLHANALDSQRSLVVGNRGVGKSFWSSVLTHSETREAIAVQYPRQSLTHVRAVLGFHEDAGKDDGPAPSPELLSSLLRRGREPEEIWRGVLLRAVSDRLGEQLPASLSDIVDWRQADIERAEEAMRRADRSYVDAGETFLLVFDALDRLGRDWDTITPLTEGVLRLALDMRGYRAMKAKVFMRTDQSKDDTLFRFSDASKIRADSVKLVWHREELFGLMYKYLMQVPAVPEALCRMAGTEDQDALENRLSNDQEWQESLFYRIAGEFMGAGAKRGRTYTWIYDHLADAFGETSPRSFITAVQKAAVFRPHPQDTVIDHSGIRAGVQDASEVRVRQLKEDYDWIDDVLGALEGLEVPCEPTVFIKRWKDRGTIATIRAGSNSRRSLLPLELQNVRIDPEKALLNALNNIGVVEFRAEKRINVPDIFRVEARIKRRGGVRPPSVRRA
jgi:hypothetical protein